MDSIKDVPTCSGGNNVEEDNNDNSTSEVSSTALKILFLMSKLQPPFHIIFNLKLEKCFCQSRNLLSTCTLKRMKFYKLPRLLSFKPNVVKNYLTITFKIRMTVNCYSRQFYKFLHNSTPNKPLTFILIEVLISLSRSPQAVKKQPLEHLVCMQNGSTFIPEHTSATANMAGCVKCEEYSNTGDDYWQNKVHAHDEHPNKMFQLHLNGEKHKKAITKTHALHSA